VQIPNRALFKAAEVCEIAAVQPYVLHSWEAEFPDLGVLRKEGGPRAYRRGDVERVLRIKQLVFVEGLTLAGVRRRLSDEAGTVAEHVPLEELFGRHARERLTVVKQGLRSLLEMLASENGRQTPVKPTSAKPTQPSLLSVPSVGANVARRHTGTQSAGSVTRRGKRRAHA
jgi:DNA-binding transcriptional MerR regulator